MRALFRPSAARARRLLPLDRPFRDFLEPLEARILLTANLHATSASFADANGNSINASTVIVGNFVYVRIDFTVTGLASGSNYTISQSVGSQTYTNSVNYGAGVSGTPAYYQYYGTFGIVAGANQVVSITLDSTNAIAESNESDNTASFTFTPADLPLPVKLSPPLGGTAFINYGFNNYVDMNPAAGVFADYRGGDYTYDGHTGWDIDPPNFAAMDDGVPILAAAPGTVIATADGNFDRQTTAPADALANYVEIDNGNGWTTLYYHLRNGSVGVSVGQQVVTGQVLGILGSSGFSTGAHLHFEVDHPNPVETNTAPSTYWINPYPYQGDVNALIDSEITSYNPTSILNLDEEPPPSLVFNQASGQTAYFRASLFTQANSNFQLGWFKPDGTLYSTETSNPTNEIRGGYWYFSVNLPSTPALGTWHANFSVNGILMAQNSFQVTVAGSPEMRLDSSTTFIADGRTTPMDFGTITQNQSAAAQTFTITNIGSATLRLGNPVLPAGFTLIKAPAGALAPGASDTLIVGLNSAVAGDRYGFVYLPNNDASDPYFHFAVSADVLPINSSPVVSVYSRDPRAAAAGRDPAIFLIERAGSTSQALTVHFHMTGTAANGSDYNTLGTAVVIPAGSSFVSVILTPKANVSFATWRTAILNLDAGSYALASGYNASLALITDTLANSTYAQPLLPGNQIQFALQIAAASDLDVLDAPNSLPTTSSASDDSLIVTAPLTAQSGGITRGASDTASDLSKLHGALSFTGFGMTASQSPAPLDHFALPLKGVLQSSVALSSPSDVRIANHPAKAHGPASAAVNAASPIVEIHWLATANARPAKSSIPPGDAHAAVLHSSIDQAAMSWTLTVGSSVLLRQDEREQPQRMDSDDTPTFLRNEPIRQILHSLT